MKQIVYTKPGVALIDLPEPQIQRDNDVKIKVAYASVCGSDLHVLHGHYDELLPAGAPMGHEASGYVAELGPAATTKGLTIGDKVTYYFNEYCGTCHYCRNGKEHFCLNVRRDTAAMSEYMVVSEQQVYKLETDADMAAAALIEPVSVCLHGIDMCRIKAGTTVAVFGGGGIGQIMMQLARLSGAVSFTMIEPITAKRETARKLGADHIIDPSTENTLYAAEKCIVVQKN